MTVSMINTSLGAAVRLQASSTSARAADGDYKVRSAATSQTKDADGDFKAASMTPAAASAGGVQAALSKLVKGG